MEGTYPLPEAQLDRFLLKLHVPFPARDEIHTILDRTTGAASPEVRPVLTRERVLELRAVVRDVAVARHVQDYAVRLIEATHPNRGGTSELVQRFVRYGASPRGAQALLVAAKARALFEGRPHVSADDIRTMLAPALRHRLILNFEGEAEGITTDRIIEAVADAVPEVTK